MSERIVRKYKCDTHTYASDDAPCPVCLDPSKNPSKIMSLYWYKELETSRPTLYGTYLTEAEAHNMCKGFHTYGRVSGIGGLL